MTWTFGHCYRWKSRRYTRYDLQTPCHCSYFYVSAYTRRCGRSVKSDRHTCAFGDDLRRSVPPDRSVTHANRIKGGSLSGSSPSFTVQHTRPCPILPRSRSLSRPPVQQWSQRAKRWTSLPISPLGRLRKQQFWKGNNWCSHSQE